jgi:hypothetical protein
VTTVLEEVRAKHNAKQIKSIALDSEESTNKYGLLEPVDVEKKTRIGAVTVNNMYGVKLNLTKQELNQVYKLRYSVYVEELEYHQPYADHKSKMLKDPLDRAGNLFGLFKKNEAIGTVLSNYVKHSDLGYYPELYKMKELVNSSYYDSSISTRLIVKKEFRSTSVAFRLALATYTQGLRDNIQYDFLDCNLDMVPFFVRLGYKTYQDSMHHPDFGPGAVLVLELQNIAHLEECNSPFVKYYRKIMNEENGDVLVESVKNFV